MTHHTLFVGLATIDIQFMVPEYPECNSKVKAKDYKVAAGGPATNAAIAFSHLGGRAELVTSLGTHTFNEIIKTDLTEHNIAYTDIHPENDELPTLASIVTSQDNGNRTVFSYTPQNNHQFINFHCKELLQKAQLLMLDGFYINTAIEFARKAREMNIPVMLDGGSWKEGMETLLPFVDIAICSNDFTVPGKQSVFDYMKEKGVTYIAVTRGEHPILLSEKNQQKEITVKKIDAVDTLGAGDFFHGAFCYYYLKNKDFRTALKNASEIAAKSCKYFGTREWMKSKK